MIVIGADTHKHSHALAAVDGATGAPVGERTVQAREAGHLAALRWARELGDERVWALEDCRHVSRRLRAGARGRRRTRDPGGAEADGRVPARRAPARQV
jgi:transposase